MSQDNNKTGEREQLIGIDKTYSKFNTDKIICEVEVGVYVSPQDLTEIYAIVSDVKDAVRMFVSSKILDMDNKKLVVWCNILKTYGGGTLQYIDSTPYSDSFKSCIMCAAAIVTNFCSLYIEEGANNTFVQHSIPALESLRKLWDTIINRLNLNMSTQEILRKTVSLVNYAYSKLKAIGMDGSLISVSEHYMHELNRDLDRSAGNKVFAGNIREEPPTEEQKADEESKRTVGKRRKKE